MTESSNNPFGLLTLLYGPKFKKKNNKPNPNKEIWFGLGLGFGFFFFSISEPNYPAVKDAEKFRGKVIQRTKFCFM